jgi:hypothetical protein
VQLDPAVVFLDDLELSSGLVEMELVPEVGRERNRSARLEGHEVHLHAEQHGSNAATATQIEWPAEP